MYFGQRFAFQQQHATRNTKYCGVEYQNGVLSSFCEDCGWLALGIVTVIMF